MGENKIQLMHPRFHPQRFAAHRGPIFRDTAAARAARELRGHVGMAGLAEIFRMANSAVIRHAFNAHQPFVLFCPIRLLMRNRQQGFGLRVARFAGVGNFNVVMTGIATRHHRQVGNAWLLGIFNTGMACGTFKLVRFDMLFVAETNLPLGRGEGLIFIFLGVAVEAIAFNFGAVAFAALFVFGKHQIIRVLAGLRRGVARTALRPQFADMLLVRKFDGRPLLDGIVP